MESQLNKFGKVPSPAKAAPRMMQQWRGIFIPRFITRATTSHGNWSACPQTRALLAFRSSARIRAILSCMRALRRRSPAAEGLVLQGPKAIVDRDRDPAPHLGEKEAAQLLRDVVQLYSDFHDGVPPHRVVVHKTSRYWPEELRGFKAAIPNVPRHDFLSLERIGHRFMRMGRAPVVRGSVLSLSDNHHVLYTVGYVPALRAYPGMRIPLPLEIVDHHGNS